MSALKKEKPSAAGSAEGAGICPDEDGRKVRTERHIHDSISVAIRQIFRGAAAWASVLGLLGSIGGMERGSVGGLAGAIWLAALLAGFVWGCRPWLG